MIQELGDKVFLGFDVADNLWSNIYVALFNTDQCCCTEVVYVYTVEPVYTVGCYTEVACLYSGTCIYSGHPWDITS